MRGKAQIESPHMSQVRITPAHAGKSSGGYTHANYKQDHPRTCGEKFLNSARVQGIMGSPPHMRGKESKHIN